MSSFVPTSALAAVLLGGCMRIYPDAELPDVVADWRNYSCDPAAGDVHLEVRAVDKDELHYEATAPCEAGSVTIEDLDRVRYRVDAYLLDRAGEIFSVSPGEADLRNGLNHRVDPYWNGYSNFTIAWKVEVGESCESLGIDGVGLEQLREGVPDYQTFWASPCDRGRGWVNALAGTARFRLRAVNFDYGVVATSEATPELMISETERTDAGTLTLVPCGTSCEP